MRTHAVRTALLCVLLAACASSKKTAVTPAATVEAGSLPSNAPAPEKKAPVVAGPVTRRPEASPAAPAAAPPAAASGPMTAAEAAAIAAAEPHGAANDAPATAAGADASRCTTDAECTFTRFSPGACCPLLCTPRAVTKTESEALEGHAKACARTHDCPQPACRPPRAETYPACVQNRCVARERGEKGPQ